MRRRAPFALIWTRADHQQGLGDLFSSLAVARALRRRGRRALVAVNGDAIAKTVVEGRRHVVQVESATRASALRDAIRDYGPAVLVLNKMANGLPLLRAALSEARRVVSIDDVGPHAALVRHRIYPLYPPRGFRGPQGPALVPLPRELRRRGVVVPAIARRILVTQGGADTSGFTPAIVRAVGDLPWLSRIDVVVGPLFRHEPQLQAAVASVRGGVVVHRNPSRFDALMRRASLAISAGGLTLFELARLGVPSIVVANERFEVTTAALFARHGAALNLGYGGDLTAARLRRACRALAVDRTRRRRMGRMAQRIADGRGADRIAELVVRWADM